MVNRSGHTTKVARHGPSFIYYKSKTCAPCKQFSKVLTDYENDTGRLDHMIVDIDGEDGYEWAANYAIRSVPTIVLLDVKGEMFRRLSCAQVDLDGLKALVELADNSE